MKPIRRIRSITAHFLATVVAVAVAVADVAAADDPRVMAATESQPSPRRLLTNDDHVRAFDEEVHAFARLLDLPGLVVVIAQDGKIVHRLELGYSDIESRERATVNHLFWLASVTKTFAATLIMQMVDEGLVRLDDPMIDYWFPSFFPTRITPDYRLRHVLGHTAQGTPGRTFVYSGGRYGFAYGVFEKVGGLPLKERLIRRILVPLGLKSTMPGIGDDRYKALRDRLVTPYRYDPSQRRHVKAEDVLRMGDVYASTGMASSAIDLVRYAHALDTNELLSAGSHEEMTRAAISTDGHALPYGVGWFVQERGGEKLVWHYGYGDADSALLVRVPRRRLTMVVLANSDRLSATGLLGGGNLLTSPIAVSFVKHHVSPATAPFASPDYDAPVDRIRRDLDALPRAGASAIYEDEVFAQALARDSLGSPDSAEAAKASGLLRWLYLRSPERVKHADLAALTLLSRQKDADLVALSRTILDFMLAREPENPEILVLAARIYENSGDAEKAIVARRRLADLKGYEDDPRKREAALWIGKHLSQSDPVRARDYLWSATTWWFKSGGSGDLGDRIARAIDELRKAKRPAAVQEVDRPVDAKERAAVIDAMLEKILRIYVDPDVAGRMEQAIRAHQAKKDYDAITSARELARVLTRDLRDVCKDDHLELSFSAAEVSYDAEERPDPNEVEEFRRRGMRRNYEFRKVERLDGGIGLLQVDGFYPAEWIAETAAGAMTFLANSDSIILDLRQNHGGQSGEVLLCSYFFKGETHLTDFFNRPENATRQVWTYPVAGAEKFADKDLYILTSSGTFSAGEALARDMQALKRATVVGEPTPGGAHGTTLYRIKDHFSASIPFCKSINPATGKEGGGVKPDVFAPADQALLAAHLMALRKALARNADRPDIADDLRRIIAVKERELDAMRPK